MNNMLFNINLLIRDNIYNFTELEYWINCKQDLSYAKWRHTGCLVRSTLRQFRVVIDNTCFFELFVSLVMIIDNEISTIPFFFH